MCRLHCVSRTRILYHAQFEQAASQMNGIILMEHIRGRLEAEGGLKARVPLPQKEEKIGLRDWDFGTGHRIYSFLFPFRTHNCFVVCFRFGGKKKPDFYSGNPYLFRLVYYTRMFHSWPKKQTSVWFQRHYRTIIPVYHVSALTHFPNLVLDKHYDIYT